MPFGLILNAELEVKVKAPPTRSRPYGDDAACLLVQQSIKGKHNALFDIFVGRIWFLIIRAELVRYRRTKFSLLFGIIYFNSCRKLKTMMPLLLGNQLRMSLLWRGRGQHMNRLIAHTLTHTHTHRLCARVFSASSPLIAPYVSHVKQHHRHAQSKLLDQWIMIITAKCKKPKLLTRQWSLWVCNISSTFWTFE